MSKTMTPSQARHLFHKRASVLAFGMAVCLPASFQTALADEHAAMNHDHAAMHHDHGAMMDHSQHQAMLQEQKPITRSMGDYRIPNVTMTGADGNKVTLNEALGNGPVMLNFVFTTCTTICPVMTATFSEVQGKLGADAAKLRMVSVSLDPDQDTPARLKEYAAKFHAGSNWQFLTGSLADSITVQKAFEAYRGDKMNHTPLTLLRAAPGSPWVRVDGFASAADLLGEYRKVVGNQVAAN